MLLIAAGCKKSSNRKSSIYKEFLLDAGEITKYVEKKSAELK